MLDRGAIYAYILVLSMTFLSLVFHCVVLFSEERRT